MNFIIQQIKGICELIPINVDVGTADSEIIHTCKYCGLFHTGVQTLQTSYLYTVIELWSKFHCGN